MKKKYINLFIVISSLLLLTFYGYLQIQKNRIQAVEGTNNPEGFIVEIDNNNGKILKGENDFDPDRPVIRPTYQGTQSELLEDVIGPKGKYKGFFDPTITSGSLESRNLQSFKRGETLIYRNVGRHNNRPLALKIDFLGEQNQYNDTVGVTKEGSLKISLGSGSFKPIDYQLVYDEDQYPPVKDVYLELPSTLSIGMSNAGKKTAPTISVGSSNLIKTYVNIPSSWYNSWGINLVERRYTLEQSTSGWDKGSEFSVMYFDSGYFLAPEISVVSDNNQKTLLKSQIVTSAEPHVTFFSSDVEAPFTPYYLPVRGNGVENSDTFEAKYDVGQGLTNTYETYLPESLKIVVEDTKGYFKNLNHAPIEFTDKNRNPIDLEITTETKGKKIVVTIPKATLNELKANQVNMKLNFGTANMDIDKVLENYDAEKDYYKVPLTFYNISTVNGEEKVSETTEVDATINQGIYGDPVEKNVFFGTNSDQLDVNELISNSATTIPGDTVTLKILERKEFDTEGIVELPVKLQSTKNSALTKIVNVPINVTKGFLITSDFFENKTWVIDSLNKQLSPKKVDVDLYESDLLKVKRVGTETTGDEYRGEHIPATINAFKNLELIYASGIGLTGNLPAELGELPNLYHIAFLDNELEGEIPASYGNLVKMTYFNLNNNNIGGTIPKEFSNLNKLEYFSVANNPLVGQIPTFPHVVLGVDVTNTQLTYNSADVPPFMTPTEGWDRWAKYSYSFLPSGKETLQLIGNKIVSSRTETIMPFNQADTGYFDLAVQKPIPEGEKGSSTKEALYLEHYYTIKDKQSGDILYEGFGEETAAIAYRKNIEYQVTLDEAFDNPANNWTIKGKIPELKFSETPNSITLEAQVNKDGVDKNLALDGQLAIFDNRDESHWKLKMTPSYLSDGSKQLQGEYIYTDLAGNEKIISDNQAMLIEEGESSESEVIPISTDWGSAKGLRYRLKPGNLLGSYRGSIMWTLEDAP
ncbi:hypothetical protein RAK27_11170 [Carnobacterium maltaromaticum]|uniref:WxL domain-containing protein n=1 Tax=Carnobacterium maltaromaticum TaxID=2751 RepID=A0AAW9K0F7_CARML|nr:hypothetical protein [Carnobacterium maltaromaticum]MDZ5759221.1 hypothetical protein [Carnobacterium maltaromaticum]